MTESLEPEIVYEAALLQGIGSKLYIRWRPLDIPEDDFKKVTGKFSKVQWIVRVCEISNF